MPKEIKRLPEDPSVQDVIDRLMQVKDKTRKITLQDSAGGVGYIRAIADEIPGFTRVLVQIW